MKKAIIIGNRGQDGTLLTQLLKDKEYVVLGVDSATVECSDGSDWTAVDILNMGSVANLIKVFLPDEVYYLAAFHHSSQCTDLLNSSDIWDESFNIHVRGLINVLEVIRCTNAKIRLFYASSCLIFGRPEQVPQTEVTPINPQCIYGITKATGVHCCNFYRIHHSIFASAGILYNHESHLRSERFVSQKIIRSAIQIKRGQQQKLVLGDLSAQADWGYAADYVDAMWRILQLDAADNFVIATGKLHTVLDWVEIVFQALNLTWRDYVREEKSLIKRAQSTYVGDSSKLRRLTDWYPSTSFKEMIFNMLRLEGVLS
ncbi:MAG: GDP-mannose 4,6-dehydratase [bacterium]